MALLNPKTLDLKDGRTIVIRCVHDRDAASLLEANKLSFIDGAGMILTVEEYSLSEDDVKTFIQGHIDGPKDLMLVADFEGRLLATSDFESRNPGCAVTGARLRWPFARVGVVVASATRC